MTATLYIQEHSDRLILWAVVLSILLHGALLMPWVEKLADSLDFKFDVAPETVTPALEFTLVSPPENPTPTDQRSNFFSTVSSQARDVVESDDPTNIPRGEGVIPIIDTPSPESGADGGGGSEVPPLIRDVGDLSDALERARESIVQQQSSQREASLPEQNPDYRYEGSARASIGGISLNTTAWDFAPYLLDLKHRIKYHWHPPLAFTALGAIHGYTWVRFRIYPDGRMERMEVVEEEGHKSLHKSSQNAIKGAVPLRKLPADFPEEYLEITFGFYYLLPGDEQRYFKDRQRRSR